MDCGGLGEKDEGDGQEAFDPFDLRLVIRMGSCVAFFDLADIQTGLSGGSLGRIHHDMSSSRSNGRRLPYLELIYSVSAMPACTGTMMYLHSTRYLVVMMSVKVAACSHSMPCDFSHLE